MTEHLQPIDLDTRPDLQRVIDQVATTRQARRLQRNGEDVAIISPAPSAKRTRSRGRPLTGDDPLFGLIGIGHSDSAGDISANKHAYLAEGYRKRHHR